MENARLRRVQLVAVAGVHDSVRVHLSFITTFILTMFLGDLIWALKVWSITRNVPRARLWRVLGLTFLIGEFGALLTLSFARTGVVDLTAVLTRPLLSAVYLWHMILLPLGSILWIATELIALTVRACRWMARRGEAPATRADAAAAFSRRDFLAVSFGAAPALFTIATTAVAQPQLEEFRLRRFTLPLLQLPPALDGLTIAHVSDLHVGRFTNGAILERIATSTNELNADLVLLTGDLINYELSDLPTGLEWAKTLRGKHGVFMCEGNHDLIENPDAFRAETRASGVPLLVNETASVTINGAAVQLLGLPWTHGDEAIAASVQTLLTQRESDAFPILLAHHPHALDYAEGVPLILAGHTHGGQLMLTKRLGFGPAIFRYWSGLYRSADRTLIVSNGVGNWFPLRTRAPAEIIHLTLRSPAAA